MEDKAKHEEELRDWGKKFFEMNEKSGRIKIERVENEDTVQENYTDQTGKTATFEYDREM